MASYAKESVHILRLYSTSWKGSHKTNLTLFGSSMSTVSYRIGQLTSWSASAVPIWWLSFCSVLNRQSRLELEDWLPLKIAERHVNGRRRLGGWIGEPCWAVLVQQCLALLRLVEHVDRISLHLQVACPEKDSMLLRNQNVPSLCLDVPLGNRSLMLLLARLPPLIY